MCKDFIGKDKLYHFLVCFVLSCIHPILAIIASIWKEYHDKHTAGNHWCWWDLCADLLGILAGIYPWILIWKELFN